MAGVGPVPGAKKPAAVGLQVGVSSAEWVFPGAWERPCLAPRLSTGEASCLVPSACVVSESASSTCLLDFNDMASIVHDSTSWAAHLGVRGA